ncbi:MAG: AraC family transcriptional regulator [Kiritimatiellae bacterium]|nr:AraC family transcriptional regulator [Kiritimatiellia bacterium]
MATSEKRLGFIVPNGILAELERYPFMRDLHVTHAGFYPGSTGHCNRPNGTHEMVLIFVAGGKGYVKVAGPRQAVVPGDLICVPEEAAHRYGSDEGWRIYWVHARGASLPFYRREWGVDARKPVVPVEGELQIIGLFRELLTIMEQALSVRGVFAASCVLCHLMQVLVEAAARGRTRSGGARERVARTVRHIRANPRMTFAVKDLAAMANLAAPYYAHLFKRFTGFSVRNFAIRCRMNRARSLLATTKLQIAEIAADLGYSDALYFSRQFKAFNGVPPTAFRMENRF